MIREDLLEMVQAGLLTRSQLMDVIMKEDKFTYFNAVPSGSPYQVALYADEPEEQVDPDSAWGIALREAGAL